MINNDRGGRMREILFLVSILFLAGFLFSLGSVQVVYADNETNLTCEDSGLTCCAACSGSWSYDIPCQDGLKCCWACLENTTCTDSDGGINYNIKGFISFNYGGSLQTVWDSCINNITLNETYCGGTTADTARGQLYNCPNGCSNGACVVLPQPLVCSDGTAYGKCSINLPFYCENGKLVPKCTVCGCDRGYTCNKVTGNCYGSPTKPGTRPAAFSPERKGSDIMILVIAIIVIAFAIFMATRKRVVKPKKKNK